MWEFFFFFLSFFSDEWGWSVESVFVSDGV